MIRDAVIKITGTQSNEFDTDKIEFSSVGRYGANNGEYFVSYDEGQIAEPPQDIKTTVHIKCDGSVVIERRGAINSRLVIEKEKRNNCLYSLPEGQMFIGIFGEEIDYDLDDTGGTVKLKYTIDSDLSVLSRNEVIISIK